MCSWLGGRGNGQEQCWKWSVVSYSVLVPLSSQFLWNFSVYLFIALHSLQLIQALIVKCPHSKWKCWCCIFYRWMQILQSLLWFIDTPLFHILHLLHAFTNILRLTNTQHSAVKRKVFKTICKQSKKCGHLYSAAFIPNTLNKVQCKVWSYRKTFLERLGRSRRAKRHWVWRTRLFPGRLTCLYLEHRYVMTFTLCWPEPCKRDAV